MGIFEQFYEKAKSLFGETPGTPTKKKDYYELLEVDQKATEDEIKKSYRKLALKWHPDKNPGKEEECGAYFIILQQAYDVLIDPRERAFYDKHKDNILRDEDVNQEKSDEGIKLFSFFQTCYKGYGDDPESFYTIYRQVFDKLATEDYPYLDEDEDRNFPTFGRSDSDYDMVVAPFYDFWTNFSTSRNFAWMDKWNLRDAPNRATLRLMEKENKKLRDEARKERNEEIRSLALYVRKRDKRVKIYRESLELRKEQAKQRVQEQRKQKLRENLEILDAHVEDEETKLKHLQELEDIENELDAKFGFTKDGADDDESGEDSKYCVACEKSFKNEKSFSNHQKSKKHKQAVETLKQYMKEEDLHLLQDEFPEEEEDEQPKKSKKSKKKRRGGRESPTLENDEAEVVQESEQASNVDEITEKFEEIQVELDNVEEKLDDEVKPKKKQKTRPAKSSAPAPKTEGPTVPVQSECKVCGLEFESRSKLFKHIEATGHAALKTETAKEQKAGKKKNRKSDDRSEI
uniref:DnaJ-like protein n=1 Tax=Panagrolaimus sp. JU765 TaxID=591449 RepID=A0AC34QMF2_9BILA